MAHVVNAFVHFDEHLHIIALFMADLTVIWMFFSRRFWLVMNLNWNFSFRLCHLCLGFGSRRASPIKKHAKKNPFSFVHFVVVLFCLFRNSNASIDATRRLRTCTSLPILTLSSLQEHSIWFAVDALFGAVAVSVFNLHQNYNIFSFCLMWNSCNRLRIRPFRHRQTVEI